MTLIEGLFLATGLIVGFFLGGLCQLNDNRKWHEKFKKSYDKMNTVHSDYIDKQEKLIIDLLKLLGGEIKQ